MKQNSILTNNYESCFICNKQGLLERHHCMFGPNRKLSEKYGLIVPLCMECHRGNKGVHRNRDLDLYIKKYAQLEFENKYSYEKMDAGI